MCPLYVAGLIGPGDRKSVSPMAERVAPGDYDRLHHFVSDGVWDEAPLERELALQADKLVGGAGAFLVIDDTTLPKKGAHSVGVAPQYASALGKTANCQTLVSLTLARVEVPVMVGLRLFLPETWTGDEARLERAGVPAQYRSARAKSEIALAELDRLIAAGVRFGTVLADAGYGMGAEFRQALSARGLAWAVGIPRHQKVYPRDVELVFPVAPRGRPHKRHVPNVLSLSAQDMLTQAKWRMLAWRKGTKATLRKPASLLSACASHDGQPANGSATRACGVCRATKFGSSASGARPRERWSGRSLMAIGMKDPVLGPSVMRALHADIRHCPPPLEIADGGHFLQEWGEAIARAAVEEL